MQNLIASGLALGAFFLCLGSTANAQPRRCTGAQLSVAEGDSDADMGGKRYQNFEFTNTSATACTMSGFPTFAALNRSGKLLTSVGLQYTNGYPNGNTERNAHRKVITLEPGKKARFQIYYNDGMALDHKKSFPVVSKVRITAPKDKKIFVLVSEFTICCGIQVSSIFVGEPQ